jgi:uncharacterized protein (TIGR00369 family)
MSEPIPLDPAHEQWLHDQFARIAFNLHLGMEVVALGRGYCETRLPWRPDWAQQHAYFHGGVMATMADSTSGVAALTLLEPGRSAITVEFKINFVTPAMGERLVCRARVARSGRTLAVMHADVFAMKAGQETLSATAIVTYLNLAPTGQ